MLSIAITSKTNNNDCIFHYCIPGLMQLKMCCSAMDKDVV